MDRHPLAVPADQLGRMIGHHARCGSAEASLHCCEHHQTVRGSRILGQKNDGQKDCGYDVIIFLSSIFLSCAVGESATRKTREHVS